MNLPEVSLVYFVSQFFYYYFLTKGLKIGKGREVLAGTEGGGDEEAADKKQKMCKRPEGLGKKHFMEISNICKADEIRALSFNPAWKSYWFRLG